MQGKLIKGRERAKIIPQFIGACGRVQYKHVILYTPSPELDENAILL